MLKRVGTSEILPGTASTRAHPIWYRIHPWLAMAVAAVLFAAVSATRAFTYPSADAVGVLFAVPIALLAVTFGTRGGLGAAAFGYSLLAVLALSNEGHPLDPFGWVARGVGFFLLGGLLGWAVDHGRAVHQWALAEQGRRLALEERARRERAALEISDSLIQGMTAAKWFAEQEKPEQAIAVLASTIHEGGHLVSGLLGKDPVEDRTRSFSFDLAESESTRGLPGG